MARATLAASSVDKPVVFEMDRAIGPLGESFAQYLLRARRAGRHHRHFAAMLLLLAQRLLEGIGVRLVHFVGNILANPSAGVV